MVGAGIPENEEEHIWNKLKVIDSNTMEKAIAKTITELTSMDYDCDISQIKYEGISGAEITLKLHLKFNGFKQQ